MTFLILQAARACVAQLQAPPPLWRPPPCRTCRQQRPPASQRPPTSQPAPNTPARHPACTPELLNDPMKAWAVGGALRPAGLHQPQVASQKLGGQAVGSGQVFRGRDGQTSPVDHQPNQLRGSRGRRGKVRGRGVGAAHTAGGWVVGVGSLHGRHKPRPPQCSAGSVTHLPRVGGRPGQLPAVHQGTGSWGGIRQAE